jgi:predicted aldo/keto reductase-like oxidoreductase
VEPYFVPDERDLVCCSSGIRAKMNSPIPQRTLGRTGELVSLVGLGGFHLANHGLDAPAAIRLVHAAVDRGITFLDNCWDYNDGESEERMGRALAEGGYRDRVFLMTKFDARDRPTATEQLDESLRRLRTDHVDLWQMHENIRPDDPDKAFAPGGAIDAMLAAQKAGKVRFLGFTGHKHPDYHVRMLDLAEKNAFVFDSVQMPLNIMDAHFLSFERAVIPVAQRTDTAIIGMKTFGDHHILDAGVAEPIEMLHYSMNLPVATVVTGIDSVAMLEQAATAAVSFAPLSGAAVAALLAKSEALARDGATEAYKTTHDFDGTLTHPEWLGLPLAG